MLVIIMLIILLGMCLGETLSLWMIPGMSVC